MRIHLISQPVGWLASKNTAPLLLYHSQYMVRNSIFTIMITAALRGVSEDLYEAADVDGASPYQKFTNITVPCIRSVLLLTVLLRVIWIFNFPDLIYSMTQGRARGVLQHHYVLHDAAGPESGLRPGVSGGRAVYPVPHCICSHLSGCHQVYGRGGMIS